MAVLRHFLNFFFFFFFYIWIYLSLMFCAVQIKDSCIVGLENRRFYLLFLFFSTLCCILSLICVCGVTVRANLLLHSLVFGRLRTPVTVEADILSSLMVFYDRFCERATAEADFLGSCREYILSLISYVKCWRSTEI